MNELLSAFRDEIKSIVKESIREEIPLEVLFQNNVQTKAQASEKDEVFTANEASEFLKVSKGTLYQLDKREILRASRLGGRVLYRKSDLLNYLKTTI
jgi:excisionase family DNA binding protein